MDRRIRRIAPILSLVLVALLTVPSVSWAIPASITDVQAQAASARAELDRLASRLEEAGEDLAQAEEQLSATRVEVDAARLRVTESETALDAARQALSDRIVRSYRMDGVSILSVLMGSRSFSDLVNRMEFLSRIAAQDARTVAEVDAARREAQAARSSLEQRLVEVAALESAARAHADEVEAALTAQQETLDALDAQVASLLEEQRKAEEAAAAERLRQANLSARPNDAPGAGAPSVAPSTPGGAVQPVRAFRTFDASKLGPGHPEAVAEAIKYLDVPYLWGGSTPAGFDCSGLVQYAYRAVGISIPRNSRTQFASTAGYIPPDRLDLLLPGDLVFFGTDADQTRIHHVGMYVGDGVFIHAPQTGDVVRYATLSRRSDYVGATRP